MPSCLHFTGETELVVRLERYTRGLRDSAERRLEQQSSLKVLLHEISSEMRQLKDFGLDQASQDPNYQEIELLAINSSLVRLCDQMASLMFSLHCKLQQENQPQQ